MGKRSDFARIERDFYPTPPEAVLPLVPHLPEFARFAEPCCGDMALVRSLEQHGLECAYAGDISTGQDAFSWWPDDDINFIITNPPWDRKILHPMIDRFRGQCSTWLLFDADWVHTKQAAPFMPYLSKIVSVGRVKWFPESKMTGKDNCAWHLFEMEDVGPTMFYGRS